MTITNKPNLPNNNLELLKLCINNSFEIINILSDNGKIIYENETVVNVLGYDLNQRTDKNFYSFIHDNDKETIRFHLNSDTTEIFEYRQKHKNGNWIWFEGKKQKYRNNSELLIIVNSKKIFTPKYVLKDIKHIGNKYNHILNSISDAFYILNEEGKILETNQKAADMLQLSKEEVLKLKIQDIDAKHDDIYFKVFWQKHKINESVIFESEYYNKKGKLIPVEVNAKKFLIDNKLYIYGTVQNIAKRKKYERALIESEQKFKALFSSSPEAVFWADRETGLITDANEQAAILFETSIENLIGLHFMKLHAKKSLQLAKDYFNP